MTAAQGPEREALERIADRLEDTLTEIGHFVVSFETMERRLRGWALLARKALIAESSADGEDWRCPNCHTVGVFNPECGTCESEKAERAGGA